MEVESDAVEERGGLVSFLGLPLEKERLEKAIAFSSFDELKRQEERTKFSEAREEEDHKFFRSGKTGHWREVLSEEQAAKLIEAHKDAMTRFGYLDADGKPQGI